MNLKTIKHALRYIFPKAENKKIKLDVNLRKKRRVVLQNNRDENSQIIKNEINFEIKLEY
ncbi:MAG: hypothetical protein ACOZCO_16600 [Bacteroidota bacterium]